MKKMIEKNYTRKLQTRKKFINNQKYLDSTDDLKFDEEKFTSKMLLNSNKDIMDIITNNNKLAFFNSMKRRKKLDTFINEEKKSSNENLDSKKDLKEFFEIESYYYQENKRKIINENRPFRFDFGDGEEIRYTQQILNRKKKQEKSNKFPKISFLNQYNFEEIIKKRMEKFKINKQKKNIHGDNLFPETSITHKEENFPTFKSNLFYFF